MYYISQTQLDNLSNILLDIIRVKGNEVLTFACDGQAILVNIEQSQPCQAANLLDSIIHLRSTANLAQFGSAMYPHTNGRYVLEKFHAFQDDPIRYFATLDADNCQRFVNWMLTSQPAGAAA